MKVQTERERQTEGETGHTETTVVRKTLASPPRLENQEDNQGKTNYKTQHGSSLVCRGHRGHHKNVIYHGSGHVDKE